MVLNVKRSLQSHGYAQGKLILRKSTLFVIKGLLIFFTQKKSKNT